MNCLLCDHPAGRLRRVGPDLWRIECCVCGEYAFNGAFAEHIKIARAEEVADVLRHLSHLSGASRRAVNSGQMLMLGVDSYVEIANRFIEGLAEV